MGDLTTAEAIARGATEPELRQLHADRRIIEVRLAGEPRWLTIEDAGRVRDALGVALPVGIPEAFTELVADPLGDLLARYARTHGPFTVAEPAARLGLGTAVVHAGLARLVATGQVVAGEFSHGTEGRQYCGAGMLRTIRRRSLAALRKEVEPAPQAALARFLPQWQGVGGGSRSRGTDGLARVVEQLAGVPIPASALESLVLPARVADYSPGMLDELTSAGEVLWAGTGTLAGNDGWLTLVPAEAAELLLPQRVELELSELHQVILQALADSQALFMRALVERVATLRGPTDAPADRSAGTLPSDTEIASAVWDLVFAGWLTNDTLAPVRSRLSGGRTTHARGRTAPRSRYGRFSRPNLGRPAGSAARPTGPQLPGRWSRLPDRAAEDTQRALVRTEVLLDRYGILTRGEVAAENITGGFSAVYPVLRQGEDAGRYRRGYFVEGLGAAQFGLTGAIDRLRSLVADSERAAAGRPRPWCWQLPIRPIPTAPRWTGRSGCINPRLEAGRRGHQPARKAGALVVLVDGECVLYVERGGRTLLSFSNDEVGWPPPPARSPSAFETVRSASCTSNRPTVEAVGNSALAAALEQAGFRPSPRGLRLRGAIGA